MLQSPHNLPVRQRPLLTRRQFFVIGALLVAALLPFAVRAIALPGTWASQQSLNALAFNALAIVIALWARTSIEQYPGIRASATIMPVTAGSHAVVFAALLLLRLDYDRLALVLGLVFHGFWAAGIYFFGLRRAVTRVSVVPFGGVDLLENDHRVEWRMLSRPDTALLAESTAVVADFSAELPGEWEAFLADAALEGHMVYQVKQLRESLTGCVSVEHLSENSFGSLVPGRAYFTLKEMMDTLFALVLLPLMLPVLAGIALAIRLDSPGPILFRQARTGYAGRPITIVKFRTMQHFAPPAGSALDAAITDELDPRITRVGAHLRRLRLDELPQIWNILRGEMSWIGPRPEAAILSSWYTSEIPFYRYRHVVKPGISGWAQVNQGHVADVDAVHRKLQYDFYYIKYFSPWLDMLIFVRTVKTMLTGFGSR